MLTVRTEPDNYDGVVRERVEWHGPVCLGPADEPKPSFARWFRHYIEDVLSLEYKER